MVLRSETRRKLRSRVQRDHDAPVPWWLRGGACLMGNVVRRWMASLDFQAAFADRSVDPSAEAFRGPCIFLFWHEYIPAMFYLRPHCGISILLSRHADAEWLAQAAKFHGFGVVRGSTARGGVAALRELMRALQNENVAITPDGPRGPRRRLAIGAIALASYSQMPVVPIGIGYDRPWRVKRAWDQFAIPRPGSRGRVVVGPRVTVEPQVERAQLEKRRGEVEQLLVDLTVAAEEWATRGDRPHGRVPVVRSRRQRRPLPCLRLAER